VLTRRPRAVVLVPSPANPYSRALRVARSLAGAGFEVEIAAVDEPGVPREERDGEIVIRRYVPEREARLTRLPGIRQGRQVALWPEGDRGWYRTLRRQLRPADLYHACGYRTVGVALDLAGAARKAGRAGRVIYDVIDVQLDTQVYAHLPGIVRSVHGQRERRWIRAVDAVVTVNQPLADHLDRTWPVARPPTVLLNCQPRWDPPAVRPSHLRDATGIPPERTIVLFLGKLAEQKGLDEAAEAVLRLPDATFVLMGFGPWADRLRAVDHDPRFEGRHFTIPPVHPDDVPAWTASADVSIVAVPSNSLNQRLSTPNKFWESLTAGTPVVVGRELEVMAGILAADDLGASADPADPADLARALGSIVDRPPAERAAMRERCLRVTRERYNWETAVQPYLALVRSLVPGPV
jgi:glycosyltransferase involved in cell wall biosynthesis